MESRQLRYVTAGTCLALLTATMTATHLLHYSAEGDAIPELAQIARRSVGLCLSGEIRDLDDDIAEAWRRNVIAPLQKVADVDVFLFSTGRSPDDVEFTKRVLMRLRNRLELRRFKVDLEEALYTGSSILRKSVMQPEPQGLAQMWYGWHRCAELIREHEAATNKRYQVLARGRPDAMPLAPLLSFKDLQALLQRRDLENLALLPAWENYGPG